MFEGPRELYFFGNVSQKSTAKGNQPMKFLVEATYTAEGYKGLAKDKASGRKAAIAQATEKLGGKLEAMYFCLGEYDVVLIADLPDHVSAAALSSAACGSGAARTKTTVLLSVEEADSALAKPVAYTPPGSYWERLA
jgi:uncharacterized protein with GYD domain